MHLDDGLGHKDWSRQPSNPKPRLTYSGEACKAPLTHEHSRQVYLSSRLGQKFQSRQPSNPSPCLIEVDLLGQGLHGLTDSWALADHAV